MERDLKAQYSHSLAALYCGTLLLLTIVQWGAEEDFAISLRLGEQGLIATAIMSFGAVLSNVLPNSVKHMLVYFRLHNVLSGHRCRRICLNDPRFLAADLERKWPKLFFQQMRELEQNEFWYKEIYRPVKDEPEVVQAHRHFLLFRDAAAGLFVVLLGLLLWTAISQVVTIPKVNPWTKVLLFVIVLLISQAAKQCGNRMVVNSVAVALKR